VALHRRYWPVSISIMCSADESKRGVESEFTPRPSSCGLSDMVVRFHEKSDPEQIWAELAERMRKFYLELHPEKTRPMAIGPFAIGNRQKRGERKPETFNFKGFAHMSERR